MSPTPKKSLGQHWLFDLESLQAMCAAADVQPSDTVLEIGPGLGPLTIELTQLAKQVIAVEFDEQLARELPARVPASNLSVINQDILHFDLTELPAHYKVVANVPYYITSKLVRFLLESPTPPKITALLVQKEVAQRIAAKSGGDMSILTVAAQFYADVELGMVVPRNKFNPPPKVDSQIVILKHRAKPLFTDITPKEFFRVVKAGFSEKRKIMRNSLSGGLHLSKEESEALLQKAALSTTVRAEELSLEDWHRLAVAARF